MKIKFLLLGTSLSFLPTLTFAQCVATQDCVTLGYTETTCNGGKGVKCPFGNKWACLGANEEEVRDKLCQELGFTLTCTGTGYAGGAGSACGGKYTQCACASGYAWKDGSCLVTEIINGADGDLYYCNGKVVAVKSGDMNFYIGMKDLGFSSQGVLANLSRDFYFCDDLEAILPSKQQLLAIYAHKSSLNTLLTAHGGQKISENDYYWSSTFVNRPNDFNIYFMSMADGSSGAEIGAARAHYARSILVPALTSW